MSAAHNAPCVRGSDAMNGVSTAPFFNPTMMSRPVGRPVVRRPEQLRLHRALDEIGWASVIDELNDAARQKHQSVPEPILITPNGTVLAGFGRWRLAVFEGRHEIECIEYPLSENEALPFMLSHHRPRLGWNAFVRIRLALTLEPSFQEKALDNMCAGGKFKGWASLPDAHRINVRREIAKIAGVGHRNVSNVKKILETAHPGLILALRDGTLTINGAMKLGEFPNADQLEKFIQHGEDREIAKVIRRSISPKEEKNGLDVTALLDALQKQEMGQPGSVSVQISECQRTVILVGQDLLAGPLSQGQLKLT